MGKRELELQSDIIKSVRKQGGYGRKLSNQFTIGIPDLLIALPPFVPCYAEVKDFGECASSFDRQIDVSDKQGYELMGMTKGYAGGWTSVIIIGWRWGKSRRIAILPPNTGRFAYAKTLDATNTCAGIINSPWLGTRTEGMYEDIRGLLRNLVLEVRT